jgi:hypothetical protein
LLEFAVGALRQINDAHSARADFFRQAISAESKPGKTFVS